MVYSTGRGTIRFILLSALLALRGIQSIGLVFGCIICDFGSASLVRIVDGLIMDSGMDVWIGGTKDG